MLDEFCNKLSDPAQLRIAIRLNRLAMPIWDDYFKNNPNAILELNKLIQSENKVIGASSTISADFPKNALKIIEEQFEDCGREEYPIAALKSNPQLGELFATSSQPITNPAWDNTFNRSVRLVYTSVWNILTWIVFSRKNHEQETHIYISINQSADALLSEEIMDTNSINELLMKYESHVRDAGEDKAWEEKKQIDEDNLKKKEVADFFRKMLGEKNVTQGIPDEIVKEVLRQMKEEDKTYWDKWEEYYNGTCTTYGWSIEKNSYTKSEGDVIAASFFYEYEMSEDAMAKFIAGISIEDLRSNGFTI